MTLAVGMRDKTHLKDAALANFAQVKHLNAPFCTRDDDGTP